MERLEEERLKAEKKISRKRKRRPKRIRKIKTRRKKDKKKEKKEKKKMKEKDRPDEPPLFAPVLKIKPPVAPGPSTASPKTGPEAPATPKLVIKNLPKEPPKSEEPVPMLGFQPLRQGPARTPKPTPAKQEKTPAKRTKRPASGPGVAVPGPSKEKKIRESKNTQTYPG